MVSIREHPVRTSGHGISGRNKMKIWAKCYLDNRIVKECVREYEYTRQSGPEEWNTMIGDLSKPMDISRPVILTKHLRELKNFSHTVFSKQDFMDDIEYDRFEIEIFPEKKKS